MLYATGRNRRRLYRPGDECHPGRSGRCIPEKTGIPEKYHELVEWWLGQLAEMPPPVKPPGKSFLQMMEERKAAGSGVWSGVDADSNVRDLREGWD